ncbi:uncharacterized protein PHACADRAFT_253363 [Phanerochaete carnosa HHB-10118-sp]|uniref:Uncharacterized protein n=1 Tax=Phanerochaete carnosa (strain HHB-10118-sp) TaxID=650164 RepID=K5WBH4_PHACS|nr:uncharacterized protein PHACADRAFT_253363 [Phanerochaete carnosa HHB-10118-sp]EKM56304.1 hypothetical protein PHACADRAFT_253363 [Phanerochaete carnosa HHB-10118-sp]
MSLSASSIETLVSSCGFVGASLPLLDPFAPRFHGQQCFCLPPRDHIFIRKSLSGIFRLSCSRRCPMSCQLCAVIDSVLSPTVNIRIRGPRAVSTSVYTALRRLGVRGLGFLSAQPLRSPGASAGCSSTHRRRPVHMSNTTHARKRCVEGDPRKS